MKFLFVTGGVLSGLGKGITASSIGLLLKSQGIKTTIVKCDMYLNVDAGTMNPIEHGEVFVTHDGLETDQDLGHYERFLDQNMTRDNYMTNGQIYQDVLNKERALEYGGVCVEPYHHIPPEIEKRWINAGRVHHADVVIVELGGTVGEYEGLLFLEAIRRLKLKKPKDVVLVHVGYLPAPPSIGELKSKPMQQSVTQLNSVGLHPDIIVARAEKAVDQKRKQKIALASGLEEDDIIANPDLESIYEVPLVLDEQTLSKKLVRKLGLKSGKKDLAEWKAYIKRSRGKNRKTKRIAIVGKYQRTGDYTLPDSYVCVVEALKHAGNHLGTDVTIDWVDADGSKNELSKYSGIIVPQGWGSRGTEGKIKAAKTAREQGIPYLGLCFGMQMATIEYGRNVVGLTGANSEEVDPATKHPVIHIMPGQKEHLEKKQYGATIRLGAWPCVVKNGTHLEKAYQNYGGDKGRPWYQPNPASKRRYVKSGRLVVYERHRHRYEFNIKYKKSYLDKGFVISGTSPNGKLVEAIELKDHPFYIGTQFHPEYLSRPLSPHPVFMGFVRSLSG